MRTDSPPASWYEPADLIDDDTDEPTPWPWEALTISARLVWWTAPLDTDVED